MTLKTPTIISARRSPLAPIAGLALVALGLTACSDARKIVGFERSPPDEFAVVSRAPLSMPPDMRLATPRPGMARPQEATPTEAAAASVFGVSSRTQTRGASSGGETTFLAKAGAGKADPNIRAQVDEETNALIVADKRWADRLIFWVKQDQPYEIVDPKKEAQRLRQNQAEGKAINEGEVSTITRKRKAPLEIY